MSKTPRKSGQSSEAPPPIVHRNRDRNSSLSIARSPSVLSSGVLHSPLEADHDPSFPFFSGHGGSSSLGLTRTSSHPAAHRHVRTKSGLSAIPSDEDLSVSGKRSSEDAHAVEIVEEEVGDQQGEGGVSGYSGGFQRPDGKEFVAILLSVTGVALLALAAGLTTVFDWVL